MKQQINNFLVLCALLSVVPACTHRKIKKAAPLRAAFLFDASNTESTSQLSGHPDNALFLATNVDTDVALYQAKLDIPFLFGSQLIVEDDEDAQQKVIRYETDVDVPFIADFYRNEMERLGWQYVSGMASAESILIFQKPYKMATVSVRQATKSAFKNKIVIFVMNKEAEALD